MLSIQYGASVAKGLFDSMGAMGVTTLRVVFSSVLLLIITNPFKNKEQFYVLVNDKKAIKWLAIYGISLGLMNLFFYLALEKIPLGLAVSLEFVGPLTVAILNSRKLRDFVSVVFIIIGLYLLMWFDTHGGTVLSKSGVLFALAAGVFWGLYIVAGKKVTQLSQATTLVNSAFGMTFAALTVLPFGLYTSLETIVDYRYWLTGFVVAILSSTIPYTLEMKAMRNIPEKLFSRFMSFEPVIATLMGFVFLKETLLWNQMAAVVLIVAAFAMSV